MSRIATIDSVVVTEMEQLGSPDPVGEYERQQNNTGAVIGDFDDDTECVCW